MLAFNVVHPSEAQALLEGGLARKGFKMVSMAKWQFRTGYAI
jgi:hypothetical protein